DGNARPLFGAYDIGAYEYSLPLSIEQKKNNSTSIYPNPTHEYFRVSFEPKYQLQVNLKVYSTTGRLVIDIENYTSMDKINIKSLSTGTYFIHLTSDIDTITSGKIQVIR
ncbi:MAG: T9SS type A sorting domain-containing protein, partial [Cyclobacteriaceae bacterium]|nr:T9SS type A sorting domain-containing protein [Cyclobacteriaceae bacterium]